MLSPTLLLVIVSAIYSADSIVVEFQPSDFPSDDLDIVWQYYENGGDTNQKAYIDIPKATFTISHVKLNGEALLSFDGAFKSGIGHVYVNRKGEFYQSRENQKLEKINADAQLGYVYDKGITKDESYIVIKYAGLDEIQKGLDDILGGIDDTNEKYYSQPTYVIPHGLDGHFVEGTGNPLVRPNHLEIKVLLGSTSEDGSVVTVTGATSDTFLSFDIHSKKVAIDGKFLKEVLGIRLMETAVLAIRESPNKVGLWNYADLEFLNAHRDSLKLGTFRALPHEDILSSITPVWDDCFTNDSPSRLEKGFKFEVDGHIFTKRCAYPTVETVKLNTELQDDGKKIIIEIASDNPETYFVYGTEKARQLIVDTDKSLNIYVAGKIQKIDKDIKIGF